LPIAFRGRVVVKCTRAQGKPFSAAVSRSAGIAAGVSMITWITSSPASSGIENRQTSLAAKPSRSASSSGSGESLWPLTLITVVTRPCSAMRPSSRKTAWSP
jgi:hypothetical protein